MQNLDLFREISPANDDEAALAYDPDLSQYMTPAWAAELIVQHALPRFADDAVIIEPSAGIGRFLDALPDQYRNIGIELDPRLAAVARAKGHEVIIGDYRTVELPVDHADAIIGNPPFETRLFDGFLERSHPLLDDGGQVIMLLPAYIFQASSHVVRWNRRWSLEQEMMPRNIFGNISHPLMLARFTRDPEPRLKGLILYHETDAIRDMPKVYQRAVEEGRSGWAAVVQQALENLGGTSRLPEIYAEIGPRRPTANKFWKEKIRQTLQLTCNREEDGRWSLRREAA